jgi:hypothetical protein
MLCPVEPTARYRYRSWLHLKIGFVDPAGFVGPLQLRTAALIQFRPEDLDPAPDAGSVDTKGAFSHQKRHLPVTQRGAQVPRTQTRMIGPS